MNMDPHMNHSSHENHTHGMDMDMHMDMMKMYFNFDSVSHVLFKDWAASKGGGM